MWIYEKKLERPICVSCPDVAFAKLVITQYGGPDGELSASLQYINQRYSMPTNKAKAVLTDIGTEELAHQEMIASLVYKLIEGACPEDFKKAGWGGQWAQHGCGTFWTDANGVPWSAKYISCAGDPITDLVSNMAAEQRARATYEHLIAATCDPHVKDMLRFLWEREVVHFQRFGEAKLAKLSGFCVIKPSGFPFYNRLKMLKSNPGLHCKLGLLCLSDKYAI